MTDSNGFIGFVKDARNLLLLAILLGQIGVGGALWLTRDQQVDDLETNQLRIMRILRQDFREECTENGNPIADCEKRLRSDDRYWPSTNVFYRTDNVPPTHFMYALYRG